MTRRELDLFQVVASSLILTAIILAIPSAKPARIILGLPFVLFFPGYTLMAALFPRKDDIDPIERTALSLGLSIAVVPLIGLALNYSPWGIRLDPILASVTLFIVLTAAVAVYRRQLLPSGEASGVTIDIRLPRWSQVRPAGWLLGLALALSLAGLGAGVFFAATSRGNSESFTEFYVLGPGGKAENYPSVETVGDKATVILGVVNQEGKETTYRIAVTIDGESTDSIDGLALADGDRRENEVALTPTHAGNNQKVEFLLYREGQSEPYRSLHLFIDVKSAVPAVGTPPGVPSPAPSPSPSPGPSPEPAATINGPAGVHYLVQAGDTLAILSERFGLNPGAIATANGLDASASLQPGQELVVPGVVYNVRPGDTLTGIAAAFHVSMAAIVAANDIKDASVIKAGQEIVIPKD